MYMVTMPTVSPLSELCRQRFFGTFWAEIFFLPFSPPPYSHPIAL